jgi:glycosyltransferase involved in cell wall biosynthesis
MQAGKIGAQSRVLLVDDGSTDRTWSLIDGLCREDSMFCAIALSRNFGHQAALLAGLHAVRGDAVVSVDADLQDDLGVLEEMVDRFAEGYDVVYGVCRERTVDSLFKRVTASGFYRLMRLLGAATVQHHADYRLVSRRAVEVLRGYRETGLFLRGIVPLMGFPSATVSYDRRPRLAGETKYPFHKMLALSLSAITSFSNIPLRLITLTALAGFLALLGVSAWVLWASFFTDRAIPGWTSILLPLLLIGCLNLLSLAVVGEHLARVFEDVKARPRYVVAAMRNIEERAQPRGTTAGIDL